jgi:gas vesicle protein
MGRKRKAPDIIIIEQQSGSGLGWLVFGAAVGAGVALLLAPASGEETREKLGRRAKELQRSAGDAIDGLREKFDALTSADGEPDEEAEDPEEDAEDGDEEADSDEDGAAEASDGGHETLSDARAELERRLAAARARRRVREPDEEEPVA